MAPNNLASLNGLTSDQLNERWRSLRIRGKPPKTKMALLRGIAWHLQRPQHGDLDAETRRRLRTAIRSVKTQPHSNPSRTQKQVPTTRHLNPGTTLVRTWRGREHKIEVIDPKNRFSYNGIEYTSLSEIARHITGARWSGPRFFGLNKLLGAV
ncbi:MAG: DUF2924 domain-containing protein [Planctomycetota bacterium]